MKNGVFYSTVICLLLFSKTAFPAYPVYDPLKIPDKAKPEIFDVTVSDKDRNREIPLRIYIPTNRIPAPVVLFSHGLGGSCKGNTFLGQHWALRGYIAVFVQHSGSDTSVWKDKPPRQRLNAMQEAAGAENYLLRVKDISLPEC